MKCLPDKMCAVLLTGHGGIEKLVFREDVPTPKPRKGEVVVNVTAAGVNNTDINTRIGWYSKSVLGETNQGGSDGFDEINITDASWSGEPLIFPIIQGADCSGVIVAVGKGVAPERIGERVLVRTMMQNPKNDSPYSCWTLGSECNGAFAQFTAVPASEAFKINCDWSDVELASIPCAYSTAENMLHRIGLGAERVLINGASGGVGSAAVKLAKHRGADIVSISGKEKADVLTSLGATKAISRDEDLVTIIGPESIDVVIDLVGGLKWPDLLNILKRGGRYITSGAIAGPIVELDLRTLYLKDLTLKGSTWQNVAPFKNLISLIENNKIKPLIAATFPLKDIGKAQEMFLKKNFVGKIVLTVPKMA
ncbi:alcohol dehydrogenase family protein [Alphaproteobacteria bacterium]|nr:alcohol dehydrogenase family protein [Alphaproteobacteria bacterium]